MHSRPVKSMMYRPLRSLLTTVFLASPVLAQRAGEIRPAEVTVQIDSGKVMGIPTADRKVLAYKGIPFAAPPVDELRWRPPQPAGRWKHVFFARDFGPHCIQSATYDDMVFHDPGPSEDCLTLNVWAPLNATPAKKGPKPTLLPVMVWIYGGGFTTGGTSENRQDGQFLAHRGVVVVSMNYRLGIFGFFAHPELAAESQNHASGNYGLMDQAAAIAWVKRNIVAFGGDPANITLFGESAGSSSVSALMASPAVNGLFSRAIGESGGAIYSPGADYRPHADVERTDAAWAERVFGSNKLFYLRQLPADELMENVLSKVQHAPHFGPDIDGTFLPDSPQHIYAEGKQAHVPLLGGWNANEGLPERKPTAASFTAQAASEFKDNATAFLGLYPATTDDEAVQSAGDYAGDKFIAFSTWAWLDAQAKTGDAPVYRYFFALGSPGDRNHSARMGAFHSDDIEYVFGALDSRPEMKVRAEDRAVSEQMQQYWVNFAKTGDPNGVGMPRWPAYDAAGGWQVMRLDRTSQAKPDGMRERYLFLDRVWRHIDEK